MKKLTPAQLRVLKALAEPGAKAHFKEKRRGDWGSYGGPGWLIPALGFAEINTMRVLAATNLVEVDDNGVATITDLGRAALKEGEGK